MSDGWLQRVRTNREYGQRLRKLHANNAEISRFPFLAVARVFGHVEEVAAIRFQTADFSTEEKQESLANEIALKMRSDARFGFVEEIAIAILAKIIVAVLKMLWEQYTS